MLANRNCPLLSEDTSWFWDGSSRVSFAQAPTMKAPVESTTVPWMLPEDCGVDSCPRAEASVADAPARPLSTPEVGGGSCGCAKARAGKTQSRNPKLRQTDLALRPSIVTAIQPIMMLCHGV